ncbi:MAG: exonuclease domain-containing protein [Chloroflexota bacterium]
MIDPRRARQLLWADLRLVVIDIETLMEMPGLPDDVDQELKVAIEQVKAGGQPITLAPRSAAVRKRQHQAVEAAGLSSTSDGVEPDRAVEILPGTPANSADDLPAEINGEHRAIALAVATCRKGKLEVATWQTLINPGVPVDPTTSAIHGLTDELLAGAPEFSVIAPEFLLRLTPPDSDTTILVAHNAGFDIGVLRAELARVGAALPDLPIIDTAGRLPGLVGVSPADRSLAALLNELGIVNSAPHTAGGDAEATALAACALLERAAAGGSHDITELLERLGLRTTTTTIGASKPLPRAKGPSGPQIPDDHLAAHFVLSRRAGKRELDRWIKVADDCARFRCAELAYDDANLVRTSEAEVHTMLDALREVINRRAADGDGPGAHTALGGVVVAINKACPVPASPDFSGKYPLERKESIAYYHAVTAVVDPLPRCSRDACPACREAQGCPRDLVARAVAVPLLSWVWKNGTVSRDSAIQNWMPSSHNGGWFFHRKDPRGPFAPSTISYSGPPAGEPLADAGMAVMLRTYLVYGEEPDRVQRVTDMTARAIDEGCRDPIVWEAWARIEATPGRPQDLEAAIAACETCLGFRPAETTDPAWSSLALMRDHLRGQLARSREATRIDENGRVVVVRRHTPGAKARRTRPLRFIRT